MYKKNHKWYTYAECLVWFKNNEQKAKRAWDEQHWTRSEVDAWEAKEAAARERAAAREAVRKEAEANKAAKEKAKWVKRAVACEEDEKEEEEDSHDSCISADSTLTVLAAGRPVERRMRDVRAGDWVATGEPASPFRRVNRVWPYQRGGRCEAFECEMFELSPRCRITPGHPVLLDGVWKLPEALGIEGVRLHQDTLYNLELEGHVDTVLVGGVVCACVGRYCGERCHGWSVWTRKTMPCDEPGCAMCEVAVHLELDFASSDVMRPDVFPGPYEAY